MENTLQLLPMMATFMFTQFTMKGQLTEELAAVRWVLVCLGSSPSQVPGEERPCKSELSCSRTQNKTKLLHQESSVLTVWSSNSSWLSPKSEQHLISLAGLGCWWTVIQIMWNYWSFLTKDIVISWQGHSEPIMFLDWSLDGCFLQSLSTDYEHVVCKYVTTYATVIKFQNFCRGLIHGKGIKF